MIPCSWPTESGILARLSYRRRQWSEGSPVGMLSEPVGGSGVTPRHAIGENDFENESRRRVLVATRHQVSLGSRWLATQTQNSFPLLPAAFYVCLHGIARPPG